ncbi:uncharacterized protein HD556DRAFT_1536260 [Suillus plorans]|uniref:Uncharacterized protein n=1 Tax=Suillus plorans TaxID=116603 RepID=A0A9P7ARV8_9AGAM|nr:uncharacterized protein HD556DRAFT_1536260 [Suillus plorans]KAG1794170.1 hypothetical protein HD556DRAFT_1536260 [Suillus plorans]
MTIVSNDPIYWPHISFNIFLLLASWWYMIGLNTRTRVISATVQLAAAAHNTLWLIPASFSSLIGMILRFLLVYFLWRWPAEGTTIQMLLFDPKGFLDQAQGSEERKYHEKLLKTTLTPTGNW